MGKKHESLPEDEFIVPRKKKRPSKLDGKKASRAREEGLVPDTVLMVESEPIPESEIKKETPETKPNPDPQAEIKQEQKPNTETKAEKKEEIKEEEFKEWLKQIKTGEELLAYLESLGKTAVRSEQEGVIFFPAYINEVKKSLDGKYELNWKIMREKIREIKGEKEEKIEKDGSAERAEKIKSVEKQTTEEADRKAYKEYADKFYLKLSDEKSVNWAGYTAKQKAETLNIQTLVFLQKELSQNPKYKDRAEKLAGEIFESK